MTRHLFGLLCAILLSACSGGGDGTTGGSGGPAMASASASGPIMAVDHSAAPPATATGAAAGGTPVNLTAIANVEAIVSDGTAVPHGGIDGRGDAYSASALGATTQWGAVRFLLGAPGKPDAISAATVKLPAGHFTALSLLAVGVDGNQADQRFLVTYTDGTSVAVTRSLSDWFSAQHYAGESTVTTQAYRLYANGSVDNRPFGVYGYRFKLDASKTVEAVTLPANRNVVVLALTLSSEVTRVGFGAAGNVAAIDRDGTAALDGGLDGRGNAYSSSLLGDGAAWSGIDFTLGAAGSRGALSSVTLTVPTGAYSALVMLATGVNGAQPNQTFVVRYTDGTTTTVNQGLSDWHVPQHFPGESIAFTEPYRNTAQSGRQTGPFYLYGYTLALDAGKSVLSVALPKNRNVVVLALDLIPSGQDTPGSGSGTPPPVPVAISGTPSRTAVAGTAYEFTPAGTAMTGVALTFAIHQAPAWAHFDGATGRLSGTPAAGDVGTFANIVIGVSDGRTSAQLPPFAVVVSPAKTGSASISWEPPTRNTDGSPLTDLAGYRLSYGQSGTSMTHVIQLTGATTLSHVVTGLTPGKWYFSVEALSTNGATSGPSAMGSEIIG